MHSMFKIQKRKEIVLERFANPIDKLVHSTSLFILYASLKGNIFLILNSMSIKLYITYHKNEIFFFGFCFTLFQMTSISFAT